MTKKTERITITFDADKETALKIKLLFASMHYRSHWGASGVCSIHIDGDGGEGIDLVDGVEPKTLLPIIRRASRAGFTDWRSTYYQDGRVKLVSFDEQGRARRIHHENETVNIDESDQ